MLFEDRVFIILYQSVFALPYCSAAMLHHSVVAPSLLYAGFTADLHHFQTH